AAFYYQRRVSELRLEISAVGHGGNGGGTSPDGRRHDQQHSEENGCSSGFQHVDHTHPSAVGIIKLPRVVQVKRITWPAALRFPPACRASPARPTAPSSAPADWAVPSCRRTGCTR